MYKKPSLTYWIKIFKPAHTFFRELLLNKPFDFGSTSKDTVKKFAEHLPVLWRQISSAYKIHRDQHGTRLEQSTNLYVTLKALEKFLTNWEKTGNNLEMSPPVKISFIKGFKLVLLLELVWSWSTSCDWSCRCCKKTFSHKYLSNQ